MDLTDESKAKLKTWVEQHKYEVNGNKVVNSLDFYNYLVQIEHEQIECERKWTQSIVIIVKNPTMSTEC